MGDVRDDAPAVEENQDERGAQEDDLGLLADDRSTACPAPPNPEDDDPDPSKANSELIKLKIEQLKAELMKPVRDEQIAFQEGTSRADAVTAYQTALNDGLQQDYEDADERFKTIATKLASPGADSKPRLDQWIEKFISGPDAKIAPLYDAQRQKRLRLNSKSGSRECALRRAEEKAKKLKQAHEDWKSPATKIKAVVDGYKDKLQTLARDLQLDDYEIYQFWFEIAPKHLGLRPQSVTKDNAPGIERISAALKKYPDRLRQLASAKDRCEGGLYLIKPVGDDPKKPELDEKRKKVLADWKAAVSGQATAQINSTLRPDDAVSLSKDLAKLAADEPAAIKKILQPPK